MAGEQATLLNLESKEFNPYWVDPAQNLVVPVSPLHYAAHRYQIILARLDVQAEKNPAQFNSGNYIAIMEKLEKLWEKINKGDTTSGEHDASGMVEVGDDETTSAMGEGAPPSVAVGISADNPFSRKGNNPVQPVPVPTDVHS